MSTLPDRPTLESMKRTDVQKLCKDFGVRANLKTEALIDLLINTFSDPPNGNRSVLAIRRSASARLSSRSNGKPRGRSGGSIVVHDEQDEEQVPEQDEEVTPEEIAVETEPGPSLVPRTRKAKDMQRTLGVGRPAAAGGTGVRRSLTRAPSAIKGKSGRSKNIVSTEDTIQEESESVFAEPDDPQKSTSPGGASQTSLTTRSEDLEASRADRAQFRRLIHTLQIENQELTAQLQELAPLKSRVQVLGNSLDALRHEVSVARGLMTTVQRLTVEVEVLKSDLAQVLELEEELKTLKISVYQTSHRTIDRTQISKPSPPVPDRTSGHSLPIPLLNPPTADAGSSTTFIPQIDPRSSQAAPIILGKRHRDSTSSNATGVFEAGQEATYSEQELAKRVVRPKKKRAKVAKDGETEGQSESDEEEVEDVGSSLTTLRTQLDLTVAAPRAPTFTVFSGASEDPSQDYIDPPPPANCLPDFSPPATIASSSNGTSAVSGPTTSTAHASENQNPFNFSFSSIPFHPVTSTPSIPYPLAFPSFPNGGPQSPTPANTHDTKQRPDRMGDRDRQKYPDLFHPYGAPPQRVLSRPDSRRASPSANDKPQTQCVNPAVFLSESPSPDVDQLSRELSSNGLGAGLGMTMRLDEPPAPPMKRTMYGTELDGDTRFGDFGVDGVANGFWTGGRF